MASECNVMGTWSHTDIGCETSLRQSRCTSLRGKSGEADGRTSVADQTLEPSYTRPSHSRSKNRAGES